MKKIIFIDDEDDRLDKLKKSLIEFDFVEYSYSYEAFFEFDKAGTEVKIKFNLDSIDFIFYHDSLDKPKLSSNSIALIEEKINNKGTNKFFKFSGGKPTNLNEHSISRDELYDNFKRFIKHYLEYKEWFVLALTTGDYLKNFAKKKLNKLYDYSNLGEISGSREYHIIADILGIAPDPTKKFANLITFFEEINNQIEEL